MVCAPEARVCWCADSFVRVEGPQLPTTAAASLFCNLLLLLLLLLLHVTSTVLWSCVRGVESPALAHTNAAAAAHFSCYLLLLLAPCHAVASAAAAAAANSYCCCCCCLTSIVLCSCVSQLGWWASRASGTVVVLPAPGGAWEAHAQHSMTNHIAAQHV
jgi:hypothetical protein